MTINDSESRRYETNSRRPMIISVVSSLVLILLIAVIYYTIIRKVGRLKVIIDTDGGVDDASAIFLALSPELDDLIDVLSITTVSGNTDIENVTRNVLLMLSTAGKKNKIPVYMGAHTALLVKHGELNEMITFFYGRDGLGDTEAFERPSLDNLSKKPAALNIIDTVRENPGEVTLLCIGPLTNIALAVKLYPNLLNEVKSIYITGGSIEGRGNIGSSPTWKEFNIAQDPEAANIVFMNSANILNKIYILPWEVSDTASIDMGWRRDVLGSMKKETIAFLNTVDTTLTLQKLWQDIDSVLISVYLFKDQYKLITSDVKISLSIVTCPKEMAGSTVLMHNRTANIIAIKNIDQEIYKDILLKYL